MPSHKIHRHIIRGLKLALIPHEENDYRPHLIRRYGLVAILFATIAMQYGVTYAQTTMLQNNGTDISSYTLLKKINIIRTDKNLTQFNLNEKLNTAAELKLEDMFKNQYWDHNSPSGVKPWKWITDAGYDYYAAGENLARDFASTDSVITAWMDSTEHRKNLMSTAYQDVGFAVGEGQLNGQTTLLIVALFGASGSGSGTVTQSAADGGFGLLTKLQLAIKTYEPYSSIALLLIIFGIFASVLAHFHRHKLPKRLKKTLYRHHGLIKASGLAVHGVTMLLTLGVGQIL